jgi:hypothetical protein
MLIDGKYFNQPERCYLPFFRHYKDTDGEINKTWYLGAHTIVEHVVILDNSPYVKNNSTNCEMRFATTFAERSANHPLTVLYNSTEKADGVITNTRSFYLYDSTVYTPPITIDGKESTDYNALIEGDKMTSWYSIGAPPTPDTPTKPD